MGWVSQKNKVSRKCELAITCSVNSLMHPMEMCLQIKQVDALLSRKSPFLIQFQPKKGSIIPGFSLCGRLSARIYVCVIPCGANYHCGAVQQAIPKCEACSRQHGGCFQIRFWQLLLVDSSGFSTRIESWWKQCVGSFCARGFKWCSYQISSRHNHRSVSNKKTIPTYLSIITSLHYCKYWR